MQFVSLTRFLDAGSTQMVTRSIMLDTWVFQAIYVTFAFVVLVLPSLSVQAAESLNLRADHAGGRIQAVKVIVHVTGQLKLNPDGKKVTTRPLTISGELRYDEKLLRATGATRRAARWYRQAKADIDIGGNKLSPQLRDDRRLIVAQSDGEQTTLFAPLGQLYREELELIDVQGGSLVVAELLPRKAVKIGQSWTPTEQTLAQLLGLDAISNSDVSAKLAKVEKDMAIVEMEGSLSGAVGGVASEIDLKAKINFNLESRQITWLALSLREDRAIGHAEPGFEVTASLGMAIGAASQAPQLSDDALTKLPLAGDQGAKLLEFESEPGHFALLHDRRWRVMTDHRDVTIFRLVDQGDLIAQCNVSSLPPLKKGEQLELQGFQNDIRKALGDKLGQFVEAGQSVSPAGVRTLRVVALGTVEKLPIQWTYYHLSNDQGRRAACVFTHESSLTERFAETDRTFGSSFRFLDLPQPQQAKADKAAADTASAAANVK